MRDNNTGQGPMDVSPDYNAPLYDVYEIEYLHGYNRGDARFENIVPGTYYLRIKVETVDRPTRFVVNYASNSRFSMEEVNLEKKQTSAILRQSMASLIGSMTNYSLDTNLRYE